MHFIPSNNIKVVNWNNNNDYTTFATFPNLGQQYVYSQSILKEGHRPPPQTSHPMRLCLSLLKIVVEVTVDGTVAFTKLVQRFINKSESEIYQAHYTFPLYNGAVVTALKCFIGDHIILVRKVKPKEDARITYKAAIKQKYTAALLEEYTPKIFKTIIRNISSITKVKVKIKYISKVKAVLLNRRKEGLELIIPMFIIPRYSKSVSRDYNINYFASIKLEGRGLNILIKINNNSSIKGVE